VLYRYLSSDIYCNTVQSASYGAGDDHITLSVLQYPASSDLRMQVGTQKFLLGGRGAPRLYRSNLCLILKTMLRKSCRKYESNITLFAAEFMYVQTNIAKCSMPLAPDYKSRCLIYLVFASLDV